MKTYIFNGKFMSDKHNEKSVFIAMEGDNNSGVVSFELDRYSPDRKGVDLGGYAWQLEVKGYILPEPHENVIGELTGLSKEVRGSTISVRWTVGGENTFLSGEGEAQLKAIGANGEVWKSEPFTVVVGQSINADGVAELYPGILTELSARALALEGRMDTAESDIETLQGNVDALGSDKQDKYDETLTTTDKTVVGAINEVKNASDIAKQTADGIDGKATQAMSDAAEALEQVGDKYTKPLTGIPKSDLEGGVQTSLDNADTAIQASEKGSVGGVAPLDANGHIPEQYMPGSYDEIRYYDNYASFPSTGTADIIYVARDTNLQYRWGGESYVPMGSHLALGETESTAYRGDRGKEAYDARHSHTNKSTLDAIPTPTEGDEGKVITVNEDGDGYELAEPSGGTEILVDGEPVEGFDANSQYYQESVGIYVGGGEDGGTQVDINDEALKLTHNDSGTSLVVEDGAVKAITNVDEPFMAVEDEDVVTKKFFEDNAPEVDIEIASQAEALAGTDNTKMMTPLRVTEAFTGGEPILISQGFLPTITAASANKTYMVSVSSEATGYTTVHIPDLPEAPFPVGTELTYVFMGGVTGYYWAFDVSTLTKRYVTGGGFENRLIVTLKLTTHGWTEKSVTSIQADWNQTDSLSAAYIKNKPTIPTVPAISTDIAADATSDVKTVSPKAVKTYVDGAIPAPYTLPTASDTVKGGVKVGAGLEMDGETLNATGGDSPITSVSIYGDW